MKLLLKKDVGRLGLVGDVVEVTEGYARNYLLPQRLAVEPTSVNIKAIAEARARAAEERKLKEEERKAAAQRLAETEVTIKAAANEEGILYGSVGPREIAAALRAEGHTVQTEQIQLHDPIRHLDNVLVPVRFADDIAVEVKVWVVREVDAGKIEGDEEGSASMEAGYRDDHGDHAEEN